MKKMDDNKQNSEGTKKILKVFIFVIIGVVVVEMLFLIALLILVINGVIDSSASSVFMSDSLLSTGLTIIGIAVSAWAGLNIANAIDRKNLQELEQKNEETLESFKKEHIDSIRTEYNDALAGFRKEDIEGIRKEYAKALDSFRKEDIEGIRTRYEDAINGYRKENQEDNRLLEQTIKQDNKEKIASLQQEYEKQLENIKQENEKAIAGLQQEQNTINNSIDEQIQLYSQYFEKAQIAENQRKVAELYELIAELMQKDGIIETTILRKELNKYQPEESVSITELVQLERLYTIVYLAHRSEYVPDDILIHNAETGIEIANRQLKNTKSEALQNYLKLRIASFYFYQGYCELHEKRQECFDNAIEFFTRLKDVFKVSLPPNESILDKLDHEKREISAYFYTAIGESNSKVIHLRENNKEDDKFKVRLGNDFIEYGKEAKENCDYAQQFVKKEEYLRNYGCAIERADGITGDNFEKLKDIYLAALDDKATESAFKVILSLLDKRFNQLLSIKSVYGGERIPALNDSFYHDNYLNLSNEEKGELKKLLEDMERISSQAEKLYPTSAVGYTYKCIYYRDKCVIGGPNSNTIKDNLHSAQENLDYLIMVKPNLIRGGYDGLTNLIIMDLQALDPGKDNDDRIIRDYKEHN